VFTAAVKTSPAAVLRKEKKILLHTIARRAAGVFLFAMVW
jgi:hypothetical protein